MAIILGIPEREKAPLSGTDRSRLVALIDGMLDDLMVDPFPWPDPAGNTVFIAPASVFNRCYDMNDRHVHVALRLRADPAPQEWVAAAREEAGVHLDALECSWGWRLNMIWHNLMRGPNRETWPEARLRIQGEAVDSLHAEFGRKILAAARVRAFNAFALPSTVLKQLEERGRDVMQQDRINLAVVIPPPLGATG